jgi:hypothetical protein
MKYLPYLLMLPLGVFTTMLIYYILSELTLTEKIVILSVILFIIGIILLCK